MKRFANFDKEVSLVKQNLGSTYKGVVSESFLRSETPTVDGTGTYAFDFKQSKGDKSPQELLMNDNDLFRVLAIRFFMLNRLTSNKAIAVPQYYPNPIIFDSELDDAIVGTFDPLHLEAFYNAGYLSYKKGDTTYIKALSLRDTRFASQTQQSSAANKSSTEVASMGMLVLSRPFNIIGTDIGDLVINVPDPAALKIQFSTVANVTTTPRKIILGIQLEGILFSGGNKITTANAREALQMV